MPNKKNEAWEATSWDELKQLITLDEVKQALRAREVQRLAHKRYTLKKQATFEAIKARRAEDPDFDKRMKEVEAQFS